MNTCFKSIHTQLVRFHTTADLHIKVSFKAISIAFSGCKNEQSWLHYDAIDKEIFELLEINRQIEEVSSNAYKKGIHQAIMKKEIMGIASMMNKLIIIENLIKKSIEAGCIKNERELECLINASEINRHMLEIAQISIVVIEKALNKAIMTERISVLQDCLKRYFKSSNDF